MTDMSLPASAADAPAPDAPPPLPAGPPPAGPPPLPAGPPPPQETDIILVYRGRRDAAGRPTAFVGDLPARDLTRAEVQTWIGSAAALASVLEHPTYRLTDAQAVVWPDAPAAPAAPG